MINHQANVALFGTSRSMLHQSWANLPRRMSKGEEEEGKGRGRERKRKGKGEREIGSEALAETKKIANAPAGTFLPKLHFQFPFPLFLSSFFPFLFLSLPLPLPSTFRLRFKISLFAFIPLIDAGPCFLFNFHTFLGKSLSSCHLRQGKGPARLQFLHATKRQKKNENHLVRDESCSIAQTHGCAKRCICVFFSCVFFFLELGKINERV